MSRITESLKENKDEILAALPEEFHEEFKKQLEMPILEGPTLSGEAEVEAIKAELVANPSVDEHMAAGELKEISAPGKIKPITDEEAKAEEEKLLAEVKAGLE